MPAKSIDSYRDTLLAVMNEFKPQSIMEWGPGVSTQIMSEFPSVNYIRSVEHDENFFEIALEKNHKNSDIIHQPNGETYPREHGNRCYDLVFIDGRERPACMRESQNISSIIILHDAARSDYRSEVNAYKYKFWTDEGNTVVLTNDASIVDRLLKCLAPLQTTEPKEEKIVVLSGDRTHV